MALWCIGRALNPILMYPTWAQGPEHLGFLTLKNRMEVKAPSTSDVDGRSSLRLFFMLLFFLVPLSTVSLAFSSISTKGGFFVLFFKGTIHNEIYKERRLLSKYRLVMS